MSMVRDVRRARGLTQRALGQMMGWSQAKVSRIERGVQRMTVDELRRLARVLVLTTDERLALLEAA